MAEALSPTNHGGSLAPLRANIDGQRVRHRPALLGRIGRPVTPGTKACAFGSDAFEPMPQSWVGKASTSRTEPANAPFIGAGFQRGDGPHCGWSTALTRTGTFGRDTVTSTVEVPSSYRFLPTTRRVNLSVPEKFGFAK